MNALIFGANIQDGHYELCMPKNIETVGVSRSGEWVTGDVSRYDRVKQVIKEFHPTYIFHVAANPTIRYDTMSENHASENKHLVSNPGIINAVGWHPEVGLKDLAKRMVTCGS
jgi:GDP-D-mannose dehydratase